eukprot:5062087-Pleurochrysis_carterae.AAC.1
MELIGEQVGQGCSSCCGSCIGRRERYFYGCTHHQPRLDCQHGSRHSRHSSRLRRYCCMHCRARRCPLRAVDPQRPGRAYSNECLRACRFAQGCRAAVTMCFLKKRHREIARAFAGNFERALRRWRAQSRHGESSLCLEASLLLQASERCACVPLVAAGAPEKMMGARDACHSWKTRH